MLIKPFPLHGHTSALTCCLLPIGWVCCHCCQELRESSPPPLPGSHAGELGTLVLTAAPREVCHSALFFQGCSGWWEVGGRPPVSLRTCHLSWGACVVGRGGYQGGAVAASHTDSFL